MKTTLPWADTHRSKRLRASVIDWALYDSNPFFARVARAAGLPESTVRNVLARQPYAARTLRRVIKAIEQIKA